MIFVINDTLGDFERFCAAIFLFMHYCTALNLATQLIADYRVRTKPTGMFSNAHPPLKVFRLKKPLHNFRHVTAIFIFICKSCTSRVNRLAQPLYPLILLGLIHCVRH